ncbi:hypothetical protein AB0M12_42355 [Nocardia vinacea]|uniref:hypothetical protein n=1 Tax=Nocardia vinacea TaxID=96468 RepID=UPI00342AE8E4
MEIITGSISAAVGALAARPLKRRSGRIAVNADRDSFGFHSRPHHVYVPVLHPEQLMPLTDMGDRTRYSKPYKWVEAQGGADIAMTSFQFTVHAKGATVDIIGASPLVEEIAAAPGIALVPPPSGGPLHLRHVSVNLDAETVDHRDLGDSAVVIRDLDNPDALVSPFAASLQPGESELFHVEAFTGRRSVQWGLLLKIRVDGKAKDEFVTRPNEQMFVTLERNDPAITARYEFNRGQWVPPMFG